MMLYPQTNSQRLAIRLDGIWAFCKDPRNEGVDFEWFRNPPSKTIPMPVPAAFNEMTSDPELRDYFGMVWYFTRFEAPAFGKKQVLRFGAAVHGADIWLNGTPVGKAQIGRLPFECEVTDALRHGENLLAVRISTVLNWQTIPPGQVKELPRSVYSPMAHGPSTSPRPEYHFDFLNYGGLMRSVWLLALPEHHLESLKVETQVVEDTPVGVRVNVSHTGPEGMPVRMQLLDAANRVVAEGENGSSLCPDDPQAWSPDTPTLYTLQVRLGDVDRYQLPLGLRTVRVTPDAFLLNGRPIHFRGCGLHEDFSLVGQGHSDARMVKDLTLLKQMGANSFRTSHYPYDESAYQLADRLGLLVINETPAVGLNAWDAYQIFTKDHCNASTLARHLELLERLIARDHHHPSVVMWSLANEPACFEPAAADYFDALFAHCRAKDPQRLPVTVVLSSTPPGDAFMPGRHSLIAKHCDVLCWNRYYGWYENHGHLEDIAPQLRAEAEAWRKAYPEKPLFLAEFGADAVAGMHGDPPIPFSEEYQVETIRRYTETLDTLPYVIGEHVWNLCDFMTKAGLTRVIGNRKGIHTRDRQPKMAAHFLKARWQSKNIQNGSFMEGLSLEKVLIESGD